MSGMLQFVTKNAKKMRHKKYDEFKWKLTILQIFLSVKKCKLFPPPTRNARLNFSILHETFCRTRCEKERFSLKKENQLCLWFLWGRTAFFYREQRLEVQTDAFCCNFVIIIKKPQMFSMMQKMFTIKTKIKQKINWKQGPMILLNACL